jgi:protein-L-isoaspartate(D-aspartate) O-methyltransferase
MTESAHGFDRRPAPWRRLARAGVALALAFVGGCRTEGGAPAGGDFAARRQAMVEQQLRARGIEDERVLTAMATVPREEFVPAEQRPHAYQDGPLPIGEGQTISQPYIVALMTELLEIGEGEKVLEIGTGSGYQAAILAELTPQVYTIEILPALAERAEQTLRRLGYETVKVRTGDGYQGWPEHAPFDAIIVTCAPANVPEPLKEQLREGGRMVIPVGPQWTHQTLYVLRKRGEELESKAVIPVSFVPMVH